MPKYTYVSRNRGGERITAMAEAETRQTLMNDLRDRGLTVIEIKEISLKSKGAGQARKHWLYHEISFGNINTSELAIFWREFATMVDAGLPIVDALQAITEELESERFRSILQKVIASIWEGYNFSDSLRKHPRVFSPMVVALIGAAEESGSLPEIANQLATFLENRDRLIRKVRAALTYPIFLTGFFVLVLFVATFWIIPKFQDIYSGFNADLPTLTKVIFALNSFVLTHFHWIALFWLALTVAFVLWVRRPAGREIMDRILLKLPIFGKLLQRAAIARFCRSLAILLSGGIPINRALEMSENTSGNRVVARAIRFTREELLKGNKLAASLKIQPVFPRMVVRMVSAGEETGNVSNLLEKLADFYESRVDAALTTINALIEPIFIVVIGLFVLVFILSLYLPIFSLGMAMGS